MTPSRSLISAMQVTLDGYSSEGDAEWVDSWADGLELLETADLRGALGLTPSQICSARSRRGAVLDDAMQVQVDAQCGTSSQQAQQVEGIAKQLRQ